MPRHTGCPTLYYMMHDNGKHDTELAGFNGVVVLLPMIVMMVEVAAEVVTAIMMIVIVIVIWHLRWS